MSNPAYKARNISKFQHLLQTAIILTLPATSPVALLIILLESGHAAPNNPENSLQQNYAILFIGNSHTFVGNVPAKLHALASLPQSCSHTLHIDSITKGGATFQMHWEGGNIHRQLRNGQWDYVILQGASWAPLHQPNHFSDYALQLANLATSHGARPVFYETWAYAAGHEIYRSTPRLHNNPLVLQNIITKSYSTVAAESDAALVPVGRTVVAVDSLNILPRFYAADGNHATETGAWLIALHFYAFFCEPPLDMTEIPGAIPSNLHQWFHQVWPIITRNIFEQ